MGGRRPPGTVQQLNQGGSRTADEDTCRESQGGEQVDRGGKCRPRDPGPPSEAGERDRGGVPDRLRYHRYRPAGQGQRQQVVAEAAGVGHMADDDLVHVADRERQEAGGRKRRRCPQQHACRTAMEADPHRPWRENDEQRGRNRTARYPAHREAHQSVTGRGQADRDGNADPVVRLLDHHPQRRRAPLQNGPRSGHQPADQHAECGRPDHRHRGRCAHSRRQHGRHRVADRIDGGAGRDRQGGHRRRDALRRGPPEVQRTAHAQLADALSAQKGDDDHAKGTQPRWAH